MKLFLVCALFGFTCGIAFAGTSSGEVRATLWTRGTLRSAGAWADGMKGVRVLSSADDKAAFEVSGFIPPRERNAIFRKVGIELAVGRFDEFERDILVMSAREYTLPELRKEYPKLSVASLRKLQREVRSYRRGTK